ncbi:hypothetical protein GTR04_1093 [Trichophyton interdigitale]|uniref:Uncharacterized protein n=1 Tax=Trichophyton interdigitale TaxID=101480 RepID=A0A9P4YMX6_9EURO|nr:hypothetical protein GY631_0869 [Trichophyton interdigitale]KAF3900607.1 hypothetical protein GY632_0706 [Trichophyton interdigitale]KAG8211559.1 hypothetical protein GTR04_1093 [Trichophyton interdigitale]
MSMQSLFGAASNDILNLCDDSASETLPDGTVDPSLSRKYVAYELDGDKTFEPLFDAPPPQINLYQHRG